MANKHIDYGFIVVFSKQLFRVRCQINFPQIGKQLKGFVFTLIFINLEDKIFKQVVRLIGPRDQLAIFNH